MKSWAPRFGRASLPAIRRMGPGCGGTICAREVSHAIRIGSSDCYDCTPSRPAGDAGRGRSSPSPRTGSTGFVLTTAAQILQQKLVKFHIPFMWASFSNVYHNPYAAVDGDRGFYRAIVDQFLRHGTCT